jgi:hypothetical protein
MNTNDCRGLVVVYGTPSAFRTVLSVLDDFESGANSTPNMTAAGSCHVLALAQPWLTKLNKDLEAFTCHTLPLTNSRLLAATR